MSHHLMRIMQGPEGFGHLTIYGSLIAHIILDMFSKNLWSYLGHVLRLQVPLGLRQ
jgi:hypothetical protein